MLTNDKRVVWLDISRIIALFAVVIVHTSAFLLPPTNFGTSSWWVGNIYGSFARMGVPLFFMVSGSLILTPNDKKESTGLFLKKRLRKIFIPLLAWGAIYIMERRLLFNQTLTPKEIVNQFVNGTTYSHLWFLYYIFGLYLFTPVLRVYIRAASSMNIFYFLLLWFVSASIYPLIQVFFNIDCAVKLPIVGYIGYFILGYILTVNHITQRTTLLCYWFVGIGVLATSLGTYYINREATILNQQFYEYLSPNVIIASVALFVLIKAPDGIASYLRYLCIPCIQLLSKVSFGIYLIHLLVLDILVSGVLGFNLNCYFFLPILQVPMLAVSVILISFMVVIGMQKIPLLKTIVP